MEGGSKTAGTAGFGNEVLSHRFQSRKPARLRWQISKTIQQHHTVRYCLAFSESPAPLEWQSEELQACLHQLPNPVRRAISDETTWRSEGPCPALHLAASAEHSRLVPLLIRFVPAQPQDQPSNPAGDATAWQAFVFSSRAFASRSCEQG